MNVNTTPTYFNFTTNVMEAWAEKHPDNLALWWIDEATGQEQKFTFARIVRQARRASAFFRHLGIGPGDRVVTILPRVPQWWVAMLGLIRLGAVPIPGTALLTARDIAYRLDAAQAKAIVTDPEGAAKAADFKGVRIAVSPDEMPGWTNFDAGVREADGSFQPEPTHSDAPGIIYFTSGTTGHPKMVLHTQASYGMGHRLTGELWLDLKPEDVLWNMSDTGWAKAAWSNLFGPWQMGACVFIVDSRGRFNPTAALETLAKYPITTWCAPPTALRLMVKQDLSAYRFEHLRHCVSAGEPLNPEVFERWKNATGLNIYEGYGQTETVVMIANLRGRNETIHPGSMGKPVPGFEVALVDDSLHEVNADQEGQIAVRVRPDRPLALFQEYWKNPEENQARFQGDWYLTGDMARRDAEGYYWFVGRADDVINSASYRIGPFEVESALIEHEAVLEAAVVGKPDPLRSQIVKAYVVLREGYAPGDALASELQAHCKRITAPYKYPREIEFVAELPKTISGKIRRVELRGQASD